ncbi:MAG: hypothetical protein RIQ54_378 [Candidatus Parcubacteria bacterium]
MPGMIRLVVLVFGVVFCVLLRKRQSSSVGRATLS